MSRCIHVDRVMGGRYKKCVRNAVENGFCEYHLPSNFCVGKKQDSENKVTDEKDNSLFMLMLACRNFAKGDIDGETMLDLIKEHYPKCGY